MVRVNTRDLLIGAGLAVAIAGGGAAWFYVTHHDVLPAGIARANGRLELTRLDIAVKYPGRVTDLAFAEGDEVTAGQVLAHEDDAEARAQLDAGRAQMREARETGQRARAERDAQQVALHLAQLELDHAHVMARQHLVSDMEVQQRQADYDAHDAAEQAAEHAVAAADAQVQAAQAQADRAGTVVSDMVIHAPVSGRIEYRIVEKGAVVPGGGRIGSMLDPSDMYLTVFYPAEVAGALHVGDQARIVLDALHRQVIPATVSFVAPEAQFTPKYVETTTEREKLVYRVKLQVAPETAKQYGTMLKSGMTGDGYVRADPTIRWPDSLFLANAK
ncbi:putative efflux pump membrane fusion protein [Novacetimonas maltaceti]|uniref:Putative efflux pump membrane fusion protein n=1 Tax=Novacetimonas maltaceti TaxID=1203393 RepID=A0A2S3W5V9_9PROT|nr:HlyD family efflux transporter periplasmic adaptor subunit [Novacetimonas maltaceti]POF63923.1 putative efflux pump membrane fusion protein [Novacetimonas maltaceti]